SGRGAHVLSPFVDKAPRSAGMALWSVLLWQQAAAFAVPCSFEVPFRDWAAPGPGSSCNPGALVACDADADCAALPKTCCPHYGPGPATGCDWLRCLEVGPPFARVAAKLCGMRREAPAGPSTAAGSCQPPGICGVELGTGNAGCFSNSTCSDPSPVAPIACYPEGHSVAEIMV
ncbi:unnamed protein product, partial [Effrenium voratum]